jgi:hypothetical protein
MRARTEGGKVFASVVDAAPVPAGSEQELLPGADQVRGEGEGEGLRAALGRA